VGPRDGLQNESANLSLEARARLVEALAEAGLTRVEIGSFVRPDWIPQLADTDQLAQRLVRKPGVRYAALVPNRTGLDRAILAGMGEVAVFMSATESHNRKNTNKTVAESLEHFQEIVPAAKKRGLFVRGYLSTIWGCPYEGKVDLSRAVQIARELREMGCDELSLGDTIGVGNPRQTREIVELFLRDFPPRCSPCTCTTRTARRSPTVLQRWSSESPPSTPASAGWAAAPMPRERPETSPPRIWPRCSPTWGSRPAWTWTSSSRPARWRRNWSGTSSRAAGCSGAGKAEARRGAALGRDVAMANLLMEDRGPVRL